MLYKELPIYWKRIFELEWESVCNKSKAIAAVIVSEEGEIISEGRNKIYENVLPNPIVAHAEVEAVRNLDVTKYPNPKSYTLYTGLEPCPMCMGTLVMGHIRNVVIAARDDYGGAMGLIEHSHFLKRKNINILWLDNELGDMQRAFQSVRELLFNEDEEKVKAMLQDFSQYNKAGVEAAEKLVSEGYFHHKVLTELKVENVFDELMTRMS